MRAKRILRFLKESGSKEKIYRLLELGCKPAERFERYLRFNGRHNFTNRSDGEDKLLIVMAGYKPFLWDTVFNRIEEFTPDDIDVCLVSSGVRREELSEIAAKNGWSYLSTNEGRLGQDQNIVIGYHPDADFIYKLDEDVFIGKNYFQNLLDAYRSAEEEDFYDIGYVAPVLNVNIFSYTYMLDYLGHVEEYKDKFGEYKQGFNHLKVHEDSEAAKYLWRKSFPFDKRVSEFEDNDEVYIPIHYQYSIGGYMFTRHFWERMGGFKAGHEDQLGVDEEYLTEFCGLNGLTPILSTKTFAGHFSYGPQTEEMKQFWEEEMTKFQISDETG